MLKLHLPKATLPELLQGSLINILPLTDEQKADLKRKMGQSPLTPLQQRAARALENQLGYRALHWKPSDDRQCPGLMAPLSGFRSGWLYLTVLPVIGLDPAAGGTYVWCSTNAAGKVVGRSVTELIIPPEQEVCCA